MCRMSYFWHFVSVISSYNFRFLKSFTKEVKMCKELEIQVEVVVDYL